MITALHFATMTNAELVKQGVPVEIVSSERERMTGHIRRVRPQWAKSIGMWGGIATIAEVAEHVGVETAAARDYAKFRRLKWRTKARQRTPAQLGVLCLATPGTACEVGRRLGLLPIESAMYRSAITEVIVEHETTLAALLAWSPPALERAWRNLGLSVEAPVIEAPIRDSAYFERIVAEAERLVREHPDEEG